MLSSETTKKPSLVWQGSTLDNYTLRLTQTGLKRIIFQLPQQPELKDFVKRNYQGNLQKAVARSVAQLARDAIYAGSISQPSFSRKLRVFETQDASGRKYQILTLPVSGTESAIVAVCLAPQVDTAEYMAAKSKTSKTPAQRLAALEKKGLVTKKLILAKKPPIMKQQPKKPRKYKQPHSYSNRNYYSRQDAQGRVTKIAGPLQYTKSPRVNTLPVPNKRKNDQSGHLIAHSFGGPSNHKDNYVAMDKIINSAKGAWGETEGYIRQRLKQQGTKAYMSVEAKYPNPTIKRPNELKARVKFNKPPHNLHFTIPTP